MLLDNEGFLRIVVSEGIPHDVASAVRLGPGEGIAGRVAQTGSPMVITGAADQGEYRSFVEKDRPLRSSVSVPLKTSEETVGVLNLNITSGQRTFSDDDLRLCQLFAEQAAMAIHKAQLLEDANRRGSDISLLFEASRGLMGVLELEPLMSRLLDGASRLVPAEGGFVCLFQAEAGKLSLGVYRGVARHEIREIIGKPAFGELVRSERTSVVPLKGHDAFSGLSSQAQSASIVPIRAEGETRALLVLIGETPDPSRVRLLETYVTQAALAIRNAQLYRQVDEKETELASIVYSMANPVLVVDTSGQIVVANPAAEDLFSFSTDFVKGQHIRKVLTDPDLEKLLLGEIDGPIEVSAGRPISRTWKARASSVSTPENRESGRILVMDDVTSEREVESLKADFLAVIGHELRTPLTAIKGYVRTLIRKGEQISVDQRQEALAIADSQVLRLERLIENLLYVSRISDADSLRISRVDLAQVISKMLAEFKARERDREFHLVGPAPLEIGADSEKLDQILFHLIDNACKYSDASDPVTVELEERDNEVVIKVIDKGVGILSGELPRVFDRFHQIDLTSTREHGGTGVGLYICKRFVEVHGGVIDVESAWGKGSTFWFTLPKRSEAA